ncbi:glycoside hydrolase family 13 protein [Anaerocolumna sp. MB42-C2]|uniref:glycoside hydrolase family 13 protein n=1 Tax=Anaerocolumna sp. MB42-C2 TaxID=3070997 RepID=UPI0027DEBFD5|nr:glycoside hydrolase family 13 protein [Anaerocolumna sp. MB42-C2]WMJ87176.1 glycoside hydrolase family 13 protein [Anaerocolumna sp. MB42-C2]
MNLEAIKHIPLSEDAFAIAEDTLVLRLRAMKNDIKECMVFYGDRVCRTNPIVMKSIVMNKIASDALFDYYEAEVKSSYTRICYYFYLKNETEKVYYVGGVFSEHADYDRTEFFQFPYIRREEIVNVPEWTKSAIMYQIFPDSFATGSRKIEALDKGRYTKDGITVASHYGGTISGIIDNMDYLVSLGINCIYLNPVFAASSYHKYDTIDYFSIDPCLGDLDTFKELVQICHKNEIKVLLDGVFNHCGTDFFAFRDVLQNGEASKYKDWFYQLRFPVKYEEPPNYEAFAYVKEMPKLNTGNPEVVDYFCRVGVYWIEEAGIDGWRLDVANEVDHEFWRIFRKSVLKAKPEAFLIGEIWEDSQVWLQGDQLDSTMNYKFMNICRRFFADESITAETFNNEINSMLMRYRRNITYAQMNLLDSHDVPRFLTKCHGDVMRLRLALLFMFTFVGIPSVFYGDEKGISGKEELEYRRPMIWEDTPQSLSLSGEVKKMISIRKQSEAFLYGDFRYVPVNIPDNVYVFCRQYQNEKMLVAINNENKILKVQIPMLESGKILFTLSEDYIEQEYLYLNPKSGIIIKCL